MKLTVIIVAFSAIVLANLTLGDHDQNSPKKRSIADLIFPLIGGLGGFSNAGYNNGGGANLMGILGSLINNRAGSSDGSGFSVNVDRDQDNYGSSSKSYDSSPGVGVNLNFGKISDNFANGVRIGKAAAVAGGSLLRRLVQGVNEWNQITSMHSSNSFRASPPPHKGPGPMHPKNNFHRPPPPPPHAGNHRELPPRYEQQRPEPPREYRSGRGGQQESNYQHKQRVNEHNYLERPEPPREYRGGHQDSDYQERPEPSREYQSGRQGGDQLADYQERPEPPKEYRSGQHGVQQESNYQHKQTINQHSHQERPESPKEYRSGREGGHPEPEYQLKQAVNQHIYQERTKPAQYQGMNDNSPQYPQQEYLHNVKLHDQYKEEPQKPYEHIVPIQEQYKGDSLRPYISNMPIQEQYRQGRQRHQYEDEQRKPNFKNLADQSMTSQDYPQEENRERESQSKVKNQNSAAESSDIESAIRPLYTLENIESQADYPNSDRLSQYPLQQHEITTMEEQYPSISEPQHFYSQDNQYVSQQHYQRENTGVKKRRKNNKTTPKSQNVNEEVSSSSQRSTKSDKTGLDTAVVPVGILVSTSDSYVPSRKGNRESNRERAVDQNFGYQHVPLGYALGESQVSVSETAANLANGEGSVLEGDIAGYVSEPGYESNPSVYDGSGTALGAYEQV